MRSEKNIQNNCELCPRFCHVDRTKGGVGFCGASELKVYTHFLHTGEEPVISGQNGSGTIFFAGCSLKCVFCQNYKFSHASVGDVYSVNELAYLMLELEEEGAHNINLVTPSHYADSIVKAVIRARKQGLTLPIVYNSSGYESLHTLKILSGHIDIYMPDFKYFSNSTSQLYSSAYDYPEVVKSALYAMSEQIPDNIFDDNGIMLSGMIIRHMVLPGYTNESLLILKWIKENIPNAMLSLMSQYRPYHMACEYDIINRTLGSSEYSEVADLAVALSFDGWIQDEPDDTLAGVHFIQKKNKNKEK